ncbi:hypothetical protein SLA2020_339510 [Shorea laevis]
MAFFEAMRGPSFSGLAIGLGVFLEPTAKEATTQMLFIPWVQPMEKGLIVMLSILLKGRFEKVLGELDQVIVAVWVGLVQLGLSRGPVERNLGTWALRRAQSCRKAKPKMRFFAKGPRQPSPINEPRSAPTSEAPVTLMKVMLEVPPTVFLVEAPGLSSRFDGKSTNKALDLQFEERLEAVRRSALEQKKTDEVKEFGAIDYDAPVESEKRTIGLGTKIGVGVAVLVFGLVFALGDFLPSGSVSPTEDGVVVKNKLSEEEKATLEARLKDYEALLINSPKDPVAIEGAAVTLAQLGKYSRASSLLEDLTKEKPSDPDVFRLLGEVKYELKDYEGSATAYKNAQMVSKDINFEVLRGLTNALLVAKKPDEVCHHTCGLKTSADSKFKILFNEHIFVMPSSLIVDGPCGTGQGTFELAFFS